jgi:branched-chain amino acid transport system substrate-binding protein
MRINWIAPLVATVGVAVAGIGNVAAQSPAQNTVKIGMVMPMTGTLASAGKQVVAGARFYMRQHGDTVAGKRIELIVKDDTTAFDVGKRLVQELVVNESVDVIGGGLTGDLLASAQLITQAKKPTVIMLASTSTLVDKSSYFVRTSCTIAQSSAIMAEWAIKNGLNKIVTLVSDFSPGHEAEAIFKTHYLAAGGQIAESIRVPLQSPDFAPSLQRARDASPQGIFVFVPSVQAGIFVKQFVERGLDKAGIKLIGPGDVADDELLPSMGDAMIGTITAHFYSAAHPSPTNKAFVEAFQKEHNWRPNFMVMSGYDGMHLIYGALKKTNGSTESEALMKAMKGMFWESPRGPMSVDPQSGDVVHNIYIRKVERVNGELYNVEFATFEAVKNPQVAAQ